MFDYDNYIVYFKYNTVIDGFDEYKEIVISICDTLSEAEDEYYKLVNAHKHRKDKDITIRIYNCYEDIDERHYNNIQDG